MSGDGFGSVESQSPSFVDLFRRVFLVINSRFSLGGGGLWGVCSFGIGEDNS